MENRYGRLTDLLELAGLLQSRLAGISIDQIAERFHVSRRTAERMLAALRDRFPEIEQELRDGHKYWHLPCSSRIVALRIPEELETLTRRVAELEADLADRAAAAEELRAISEEVLGTSAVGVIVVDADFHVVWLNHAIECYFGVRAADVIGSDMRQLIREKVCHIFADPADFERRVIASYDDNSYIENFECRVLDGPNRHGRWLEHWSQPIEKGPYEGGRIDHYVDVTALVIERSQPVERPPEITACALRAFRDPLVELEAETEAALRDGGDSAMALSRISSMVKGIRRTADLSLRLASADGARSDRTPPQQILDAVDRQVRRAAREAGIRIEVDADPNAADVYADRMQVTSMLIELACEAIDELPDGATIRLGAEGVGGGRSVRFVVNGAGRSCGVPFLEIPTSHHPTRQGLKIAGSAPHPPEGTPAD